MLALSPAAVGAMVYVCRRAKRCGNSNTAKTKNISQVRNRLETKKKAVTRYLRPWATSGSLG
ncbi:MAG: hypothetical protein EOS62_30470 [Mesorhizobium sp.]|nr:MAG: hypothetical protein EOS62_30470 [Mesorhizobium sp.]